MAWWLHVACRAGLPRFQGRPSVHARIARPERGHPRFPSIGLPKSPSIARGHHGGPPEGVADSIPATGSKSDFAARRPASLLPRYAKACDLCLDLRKFLRPCSGNLLPGQLREHCVFPGRVHRMPRKFHSLKQAVILGRRFRAAVRHPIQNRTLTLLAAMMAAPAFTLNPAPSNSNSR